MLHRYSRVWSRLLVSGLFWCCFWLLSNTSQAQSLPDSAKVRILRQLYLGTDGDTWTNRAGWPTAQQWQTPGFADTLTSRHFRTWQGLEVYNSQIYGIHLANNRLQGPFPAALTELGGELAQLHLGYNQLTGPLPQALGNWSGISILELQGNRLNGPLPASLAQLRSVYILGLGNNQLTGPLPDDIGNLTNVVIFNLANNRLSGPLPVSMGQMTKLGYCHLDNNQFSGELPASLGQLQHLSYLTLPNNRLTGTIPASVLQLPTAATIQLQNNRLTGIAPLSAGPFANSPNLDRNYLGFDALEHLLTGPGQPKHATFPAPNQQQLLLVADTLEAIKGTVKPLFGALPGQHNRYQWERQVGQAWVPLGPEDTLSTYAVHVQGESEEGAYRTRVTNRWVPNVTLYGRVQYVTLLPYAPLDLNEPAANCVAFVADTPPDSRAGAIDSVNYVRTYTARAAFTDSDSLKAAAVGRVAVQTQYLDGLGRPLQTVQRAASPSGRDLVQLVEYDELGRQPRQYLPYSADSATADAVGYYPNARREQHQFYQGTGPAASLTQHLPKTNVAFAATSFEPSPLNRPQAQASPGESWQLSSGNVVTLEERPNTLADSVQRWEPGYETEREDLTYRGSYAAGELWVKQTRDEQGQWLQEFTDKEGRVVLKQVGLDGDYDQVASQWLKTYYVYDDFGRLRAVLPPKAVQRLRKLSPLGPWQVQGAGVELLLFRYHYDAQGRLTEKKVPDQAGYSVTVYDQLDRPVLTQDVAQRARHEWSSTKYDALGRVVLTGLLTRNASAATLQAEADATAGQWEERSSEANSYYYTLTHAYPSGADTRFSNGQLLTVSYYDDYDFDHNGTANAAYQAPTATELACGPGEVPQADLRVTGQATRTQVRVLGVPESEPGAWLTSTSFFDEKLRPIQVQSNNARGGTDVVTTRYDFAGQALSSYAVHQVPNQDAHTVRQQSAYDHAGRLLSLTQELDQATPQVIARHHYNELGQLEQKQLGGNLTAAAGQAVTPPLPGTGPAALQTVDYRYNIRGWLTRINDVANPDPQDLWNFSLHYDCGFQEKQFNGNIAGQTWRSASDGIERAYGYRYDQASRLLQGDFVARTTSSPTSAWGAERGNYRFSFASYDAGGNLVTLRRRGLVAAATRTSPAQYAETDNLRYRYAPASGSAEPESNRLQRVDDLAPAATSFGGKLPERPDFSDGTTAGSSTPDYIYDAAGSLLSDRNKGITSIRYNHLHLPERIEWSNGNTLEYRYSAAGQKVTKLATAVGKPVVRTDYLGAWQYERDSLRWLTHTEGRALFISRRDAAGGILPAKVQYEYTLKDHLGNLRVAFHPGERSSVRATMEEDQREREIHLFDSASIESTRAFVGKQLSLSGVHAAKLNAGGAAPKPMGPLKQLAVARKDTILVTAHGLYSAAVQQSNWGFSLASFVATLLQQQPAATAPTGEGTRRVRVLPLLSAGLTAATLPALEQLTGGVPKAYVRILVFNSDSVLVRVKTKQLTLAAKDQYQELQDSVIVPQAGYVQAYVANESDTDVYFDDITVEHRQGLQVQENQYDPYGLDLAGLSKAATPQNQYTWNGKEKQTEFGLNWHDHGWRFYDPTLGRWVVSDPAAEEGDQESWGTYQFGLDNAVRYNDLDGRCPGGCPPAVVSTIISAGFRIYNSLITRTMTAAGGVSQDVAYAKAHPVNAGRAGLIVKRADAIAQSANIEPTDNRGNGSLTNALRHTLGQAMAASNYGSQVATEAGDGHEGANANVLQKNSKNVQQLMKSGQTKLPADIADNFVDQLNNQSGRTIGSSSPNATDNQLANLTLSALTGNNKQLPRLYQFTLSKNGLEATVTPTQLDRTSANNARESMNSNLHPNRGKIAY